MKIRPSDLYIRQENSNFAIYVDPYGGEYFYNKTLKNLSKYPTEFDDRVYECSSKTEAKKIIINFIQNP